MCCVLCWVFWNVEEYGFDIGCIVVIGVFVGGYFFLIMGMLIVDCGFDCCCLVWLFVMEDCG